MVMLMGTLLLCLRAGYRRTVVHDCGQGGASGARVAEKQSEANVSAGRALF